MKRIAWLMDDHGYQGGAELSSLAYIAAALGDYTVTLYYDDQPIPDDVDGYILGNCVKYSPAIVEKLGSKPTVKIIYDLWLFGETALRQWLTAHASKIILVSPTQRDWLAFPITAPVAYCPCPIDFQQYVDAAAAADKREGAVWVGRMWKGKGIGNASKWAEDNGRPVDFYGYGPESARVLKNYKGQLPPDKIAPVLAKYDTFVFLPNEFDPCPRSVIEAYAADCNLVLNGNVGTTWWIQHEPDALPKACERFWNIVKEVI